MIRFFIRFIAFSTLAASLCLAYGFFIEPKMLFVKSHDIAIKAPLKTSLKIAVIADLHIAGFHMPPKQVEKIVRRINDLDVDMVFIAGDFISGHKARAKTSERFDQQIDAGISALKQLKTRDGVFAVIGNHDVWYDADYVDTSLRAVGIKVLKNEAVNIGAKVCIVGLADNVTQKEDPNSFTQCAPSSVILSLMHSPDSFLFLPPDVQLAVAGHTHAGQINIPLLGRFSNTGHLGAAYKYGLKDFKGTPVYISAGLGTSILPARFRAPPEITVLTLRAVSDHP